MADRSTVALVTCADYELEVVEAAVRRSLDLLGGIGSFVGAGQRVLLKPNIVRATAPEKAVSTHPTVVAAVAKLVIEAGAHPIIVESPGGPYSVAALKNAYRKSGIQWAAEVSGAELNYDVKTAQVSHPDGKVLHRLDLIQPVLEADAIINLAKLKTHNLATLTLAVKNLFGLVPGVLKIGYHAKLQEAHRFAGGLLDIFTYVSPALNLVDAVIAMEGNGPSGGDPRQVGALVAGSDALAVDVVCAALVGFDPLSVLTTQVAAERGLTTGRVEDVALVGESLSVLQVNDFRRGIATAMDPGLFPRVLRGLLGASDSAGGEGEGSARGFLRTLANGWLWRQLVVVPRAGPKCVGCGYCVKHCPVGAIQLVDGLAQMDTHKCIRCYCCHELCPHLAVELHRPWLGRVVMGS